MTPTARHLAAQLGDALRQRQQRVATAESCTGGLIAGTLTAIPGSSDWFGFGWVSYANDAKQQMLGVSADTLARHGAVSADTVREMATEDDCRLWITLGGTAVWED